MAPDEEPPFGGRVEGGRGSMVRRVVFAVDAVCLWKQYGPVREVSAARTCSSLQEIAHMFGSLDLASMLSRAEG